MDAPGSNTRRSAASLSLLEKEIKKKTTHVIMVPLLSADPKTFSVLVWSCCVAFSVTSAELSSNPLLLRSAVMVVLFTCHLISSAIAVHVKLTVSFSPAFTDSGEVITPVHASHSGITQFVHVIIICYNLLASWAAMEDNISTNNQLAVVRCTATPVQFFVMIDSIIFCFNDAFRLLQGLL